MSCANMQATKMWRSSLQSDMGPAQRHEVHVTTKGCGRESGRGNKRARVTRGSRNPEHGKVVSWS
jgi:hypothetical protein